MPSTLTWTWCFQSQTICLDIVATPGGPINATVGNDYSVTTHPIDITSSGNLPLLTAQNSDQSSGVVSVQLASIHYTAPGLQPLAEIGFHDFVGTTVTVDGGTASFNVPGIGSGTHDFSLNPIVMTVTSVNYGTWNDADKRLTASFTTASGVINVSGIDVELMMTLSLDEVFVPAPAAVPTLSEWGLLIALFIFGITGTAVVRRHRSHSMS